MMKFTRGIDEMPWNDVPGNLIPTSEIELIKVYNPPAMLSASNPASTVAV